MPPKIAAIGYKEMQKHNNGDKLTLKEVIVAKCYDCCCGYTDGKIDCQIVTCPIYPFMPYNPNKLKYRNKSNPIATGDTGDEFVG